MIYHSESIKDIAAALASAQAQMSNPKFDCNNPFYKSKYASLAAIRDAVIPALSKHGIAVVQCLNSEEEKVSCTTMLCHTSGEWISGTFTIPVTKTDAQGYGAASTYARRYLLQAMAGIVGDEDDDANAAIEPPAPKVSKPTVKKPKEATEEQSPKEVVTGIKELTQKIGKDSKGHEFHRFKVVGESGEYFTFDKKIAELIKTARDAGLKVSIKYSIGEFGNKVEDVNLIEPEVTNA